MMFQNTIRGGISVLMDASCKGSDEERTMNYIDANSFPGPGISLRLPYAGKEKNLI